MDRISRPTETPGGADRLVIGGGTRSPVMIADCGKWFRIRWPSGDPARGDQSSIVIALPKLCRTTGSSRLPVRSLSHTAMKEGSAVKIIVIPSNVKRPSL